jgi:sugar phosphate isomerase/epimerase
LARDVSITRRGLLSGLTALAGATFVARPEVALGQSVRRYPLGLQLFTLTGRDGNMSWERYTKAMDTAKTIGFDSLELAGLWGFKPDAIRKHAEGQGLKIRSLHMGFDQMLQFMAPGETTVTNAQDAMYTPQAIPQLARINAPIARDLGCEWGVLASSGISNFRSIESIRRLCDSFNEANEVTKKTGLKFAYHMHAIDFEPVQGRMPFEMMLDQTAPDVRYQLDVCWAQAGGATPADLVNKYASKIVSFHLKDLDNERKVATPGDGVVDFAAIHKAAAKIQDPIFFVERDGLNGRDPVVEATRAYKYLQSLGWGKGQV